MNMGGKRKKAVFLMIALLLTVCSNVSAAGERYKFVYIKTNIN